jgi:putative PIN family toxin of toxin-antitoxin system
VKRVVLDTSVLVSGFRSRYGASQRLLRLVVEQRLVLLATPALFLEYEDVLKRPEQREVSGLSVAQVDLALAAISVAVEPVEIHFSWRPQLADADDEMVLEAAVNGRADALVTHNVADFALAAPKFGLAVLRPGALLERLMS